MAKKHKTEVEENVQHDKATKTPSDLDLSFDVPDHVTEKHEVISVDCNKKLVDGFDPVPGARSKWLKVTDVDHHEQVQVVHKN